jgi:hypothetical protein
MKMPKFLDHMSDIVFPEEHYALASVRALNSRESISIIGFDDDITNCIIHLPMLADTPDFLQL